MFLILLCLPTLGLGQDKPRFTVRSGSAVLGDIDSGAIIFSQAADEIRPPASLTKVMTLYLLYEAIANGDLTLDSRIPVSEKAWRMGGSKTFVRVKETVRVEDLIRGIAVQSGNDACIVVAEHLGGSESGFADQMNQKTKELGLYQSHFINASGLPAEDHYTTARDMFALARAIIRDFPQFAGYAQEKQFTYNGILQHNRNRLLWRDPSITGLKTGHTKAAGYCLIATNEKDGQRLAAVVMGAQSSKVREEEALKLLRYGNRMFETVRLYDKGETVKTLRVWKGDADQVVATLKNPVLVTVPRKQRRSLEVGLLYDDPLLAPIEKGDKVGTLVVKLGKKEILSRPVVAESTVMAGGFLSNMVDSIRLYLGW
ncbi:D-alanyl-D-alanine carboxypeptidase family protein [Magnetococcales bacterium HHB-1]